MLLEVQVRGEGDHVVPGLDVSEELGMAPRRRELEQEARWQEGLDLGMVPSRKGLEQERCWNAARNLLGVVAGVLLGVRVAWHTAQGRCAGGPRPREVGGQW